MSLQTTDIKYYLSTNGLGGQITTTEIASGQLHNVFDIVNKTGSINGETNYRCVYVRNKHLTDTLFAALCYLVTQTNNSKTSIEFGLGTAGLNNTEQAVVDELTAPVGVDFSPSLGIGNASPIGDMPPDSYIAIWFKRIVAPNTTASELDNFIFRTEGEVIR